MNRVALIFISIFSTLATVSGQEFPNCTYTYYKNKKISTSQCFDTNMRWGKATVYNKAGNRIYEKGLRKIAGHSSVSFSYYPDGGVQKAYWSSAPDGGIQWHKITTFFNEGGKITKENQDSHKGPQVLFKQQPHQPQKTTKEEATTCAFIYSSEFWFTNTTRFTVVITAKRKYRKDKTSTIILKPGKSMKGGHIIEAERFVDPTSYYDFTVSTFRKNTRQRLIVIPSDQKPLNTKKENRRYYYEIRRIV